MNIQPEIKGTSIVIRGDFNPVIFSPAWLGGNKLIMEKEVEGAEVNIINADVSIFNLEWARIQVTRDSFLAESQSESHEGLLRDLIYGIFKTLSHTPLYKIGINVVLHYRSKSIEEWHAMGHYLAPKTIWNDVLIKPGLASLAIQGHHENEERGYVRVQVEPSTKITPGIFILINHHYEVEKNAPEVGAKFIVDILTSKYDGSLQHSMTIANRLMEEPYAERSC